MYASQMVNEMLLNLCYKFQWKNFLEKTTEYQGMCEKRVRTTVTTQISINVIKNISKDAITVCQDLCARGKILPWDIQNFEIKKHS